MLDVLIGGGVVIAGFIIAWAVGCARRHRRVDAARQVGLSHQLAVRRAEARRRDAQRARAARDMQTSMLQLPHAQDFRRCAAYAAHAARIGVPLGFRQRQFRRLRRLLVAHMDRRLREGATRDAAAGGLRDLMTGLGIAGYEADYIVVEAEGQAAHDTQERPDYCTRLRELHGEHEQRLEAIRQTRDLQDDIREQLLEAEHERFRGKLLDDIDERR
jgi:hypothetical protein